MHVAELMNSSSSEESFAPPAPPVRGRQSSESSTITVSPGNLSSHSSTETSQSANMHSSSSSVNATVGDTTSPKSGDESADAIPLQNNAHNAADEVSSTDSVHDFFEIGTLLISKNGPYFIVGKISEVLPHRKSVFYRLILKDSITVKYVPHSDCIIYSEYAEFQCIQERAKHLANLSGHASEHADHSHPVDSTQDVQQGNRGQLTFRRLQYLAQQQVGAAQPRLSQTSTSSSSVRDVTANDTDSSGASPHMRTAVSFSLSSEVFNSTAVSPEIAGSVDRGMVAQGSTSVVDNMNVPGRRDINQNLSTSFNPVGSSTPVDNGNKTITIDRRPIYRLGPDCSIDINHSVDPVNEITAGVDGVAIGGQLMNLDEMDEQDNFVSVFEEVNGSIAYIHGATPIAFAVHGVDYLVLTMYDRKYGVVVNTFRATFKPTGDLVQQGRLFDTLGCPVECHKIVKFAPGVPPQFTDILTGNHSGPELRLVASFKLSASGVMKTTVSSREIVFLPHGTDPNVVIQLFGGNHVFPGFAGAFSNDKLKTAGVALIKVIKRLLEASAAGGAVELTDPLWMGSPLD